MIDWPIAPRRRRQPADAPFPRRVAAGDLLEDAPLEPDAFRPPDGAGILFEREAEPATLYALRLEARMYVTNADGTGLRQLAYTEGTWVENTRLVTRRYARRLHRWRRDDACDWFVLTLRGTLLEAYTWSSGAPGTIARPTFMDLDDGTSHQLDWSVGSNASWQRVAPWRPIRTTNRNGPAGERRRALCRV